MNVETWCAAPDLAAEFARRVADFGGDEAITAWAQRYAHEHAGRCQWDARFLAARVPTGRYLNIGGAPYVFELALKQILPAIDITTLDIDPTRFPGAAASLGIRLQGADIERADGQLNGPFDCIVLAEVFEHLRIDLLGTMARIRQALAPAGILYITMPNGLSMRAIRNHFLRGRTGPPPVPEWEKLQRLGHMGHVREYSLTELREVLHHCGLSIADSRFREDITIKSRNRDTLLSLRPSLANEIVVLAGRNRVGA